MKTPSVNLKEALAEIKAVFQKHDIAGLVVLHEPDVSLHGEWITPTWSAADWIRVEGREALNVRLSLADFDGDAALRRRLLANTLNMALHFRRHCTKIAADLSSLLVQISDDQDYRDFVEKDGEFLEDWEH